MSDRYLNSERFANDGGAVVSTVRALITRGRLLAALSPLFFCPLGHAQTTIYSNTFNGGATNINQTAPTTATDTAGAASSAIWHDVANTGITLLDANGSDNTTTGDSVLLPFTPENGYVYTLTASVTFSGNPTSWVGAGFAEYYNYTGTTPARFADSGVEGANWAILTESSGNVQWFAGPGTGAQQFSTNGFFTAGAGTHTLVLTLNTTGPQWTISCSVDGKAATNTYTYPTQPNISAFGITQNTLTVTTQVPTPNQYVHWNSISLTATGTRTTNPVSAAVSFASTGLPLNPAFVGFSYEKAELSEGLFSSTNTPLLNLFNLLGGGVLRIGGGTSDTYTWEGSTPATAITPAEVDTFAGFMKALPSTWSTIYGIGLENNTPTVAAQEATYAQSDLGSTLFGFEIGNEPEAYDPSVSTYLAAWQPEESAIANAVPGWDKGTGKNGWMIDGPDQGNSSQTEFTAFTQPFSQAESGVASLLTQHFYVGASGPMQTVLAYPNVTLNNLANNIAGQAQGNQVLGSRITEAGSISAGGVLGVSNAFGSALWALDFMLTSAQYGVQGVNFHGGDKSPYSPINNNGTTITNIGPEFYAMKLFSMIPSGGSVVPATVSLTPSTSTANFSAYGVQAASGLTSAVLINKEVNDTVSATVNLGTGAATVELISLTAPNLFDAAGFTLGGAPINTNGTWNGGVEQVLTPANGQVTVNVPPTTAYLLIPVSAPPAAATPTFSVPAGTYTTAQSVSIADVTPGASIYYTTDGSTPTTSSTLYSGPITVSGVLNQTVTETIQAIATAPSYSASAVGTSTYAIHLLPLASTPSFSSPAGTYTTVQTVTLGDASPGVAIYYTTDGSTPTSSSTPYSGPITVAASETLNAIAIATAANTYSPSLVGSAVYVINLPPPAFTISTSTPGFTVRPGANASATLTITANAAFNGTITFACNYYVPVGATCNFSPATVSVNALGTTTTTFTLTAAPTVGLRRTPGPLLPTTVFASTICVFGLRKRRRLQLFAWIVLSGAALTLVSGCGSSSSSTGINQFFVSATGSSLPVNAPSGATPATVIETLPMDLTIQ